MYDNDTSSIFVLGLDYWQKIDPRYKRKPYISALVTKNNQIYCSSLYEECIQIFGMNSVGLISLLTQIDVSWPFLIDVTETEMYYISTGTQLRWLKILDLKTHTEKKLPMKFYHEMSTESLFGGGGCISARHGKPVIMYIGLGKSSVYRFKENRRSREFRGRRISYDFGHVVDMAILSPSLFVLDQLHFECVVFRKGIFSFKIVLLPAYVPRSMCISVEENCLFISTYGHRGKLDVYDVSGRFLRHHKLLSNGKLLLNLDKVRPFR